MRVAEARTRVQQKPDVSVVAFKCFQNILSCASGLHGPRPPWPGCLAETLEPAVAERLVWVAASHQDGQQCSIDHTYCSPKRTLSRKQ
jgi:hypothetical protein